jgi:hypothetical protein
MPTPPSYKEIISINKMDRQLPTTLSEIYELEIGPNRCSISNTNAGNGVDIGTKDRIKNNNVVRTGSASSIGSDQN